MTSILGEVLKAKASTSLDEFQDTINKVEGKMVTMKTELVESMHSCFALSEADIDRITSWSMEVNSIRDQANNLLNSFENERETFASTSNEIEDVDEQLQRCAKDSEVLRTIVSIVDDYEQADENTNELEASVKLSRAVYKLKYLMAEFPSPEDLKWLDQLTKTLKKQISDVIVRVQKDWNDKFQFKRNQLVIDHYGCNVVTAVETLKNLDSLEKVWNRFVNQLWSEILSKVCCPEYQVRIKWPVNSERPSLIINGLTMSPDCDEVPERDVSVASTVRLPKGPEMSTMCIDRDSTQASTASQGKSRCYILVEKLETRLKKVSQVFDNIVNILEIFAILFKEQPSLMTSMASELGPRLCTSLSSKCLKFLILHNSDGNFDTVRQDIEDLTQFLEKLDKLGFKIPQGPEYAALLEFAHNFETLFYEQLRQDICTKSRNYIRADVHKTVRYTPPIPSPTMLSHPRDLIKSPFTLQQSMEISASIYEMVKMLQYHLAAYPEDDILPDHAFNIYLAIVSIPKNESDSSDLVPLQAAIIHNNCWYLSHYAMSFKVCEHHVPLLRTKADQAISFLLRSIRSKLNGMISNAMNGLDAKVDSKIDCSLDFLLISEELIRLDLIFKGVLPTYAWKTSLALLVDHTVNEMVSKVLQWDDISANTATELAAAFIKFAVETSHLFKGDATAVREIDALTSKAVKKWQRFRLLTFVLTASMSEIKDKWVQGHGPLAIEFAAEEVRKLVRALFQNTDRRAAFLASIK
ncbi:unnamed protein product [Allacma fusca]|uniref:ZW10 C-terminal helical domain-containing protein n=1 Tax=Allacma fusca TaxID=39272 RepID=A0A8J2LM10_9HEXA|nr:unnamed protein product [Allacma fusca]